MNSFFSHTAIAGGCSRALLLLVLTAFIPPIAQARGPDLRGLDAVPMQVAPPPAGERRSGVPRKGEPFRYARSIALPLSLELGRWDRLENGDWRWRLRVHSTGAQTLGLEFSEFRMPAGGELWVYDRAGQVQQGPYTNADETPEGLLAAAQVPGESAIIEARVPAALRSQLRLRLARLQHGDTDVFKAGLFGTAGSCNIDIACSQGDSWRDEARASVLIEANGTICSGVLVNNVSQDNTPYVLTANHCGIRSTGLTPASAVVVYWQYQNSICGGGTASSSLSQSGATFISRHAGSDYTLLRLNREPDAGFNVYYAGWDVSGAGATSGSGLHHPSGDVKKVSLFSRALTATSTVLGGATVQVWRVERWDSGVTEPGSSGSGLWNQDRRLVGLLTGGQSQCTVDNRDTSKPLGPTQPDFYGRLDVAWANGLRAALDPGNTGVTQLCGRNFDAAACAATTTPTTPVAAAAGGGGGGALGVALLPLFVGWLWRRFSAGRASHARAWASAAGSRHPRPGRSTPSG